MHYPLRHLFDHGAHAALFTVSSVLQPHDSQEADLRFVLQSPHLAAHKYALFADTLGISVSWLAVCPAE